MFICDAYVKLLSLSKPVENFHERVSKWKPIEVNNIYFFTYEFAEYIAYAASRSVMVHLIGMGTQKSCPNTFSMHILCKN